MPDQPQDGSTATGRGRPTRGASIGAGLGAACAVIAAPTILVLAALLGVGGTGLIVLAAVFAVVLAALALAARNIVTAVLAAVLALTAAIGAGGLALGARADTAGRTGHPFPLVVGLPLRAAKAAFQRHGPVRFTVTRADYGRRGIVLRATGYAPDGTYAPGATITLLIGSQLPAKHGQR